MDEKQKEKKKSKPFMKSPEKANVKNYSNKILRKNKNQRSKMVRTALFFL